MTSSSSSSTSARAARTVQKPEDKPSGKRKRKVKHIESKPEKPASINTKGKVDSSRAQSSVVKGALSPARSPSPSSSSQPSTSFGFSEQGASSSSRFENIIFRQKNKLNERKVRIKKYQDLSRAKGAQLADLQARRKKAVSDFQTSRDLVLQAKINRYTSLIQLEEAILLDYRKMLSSLENHATNAADLLLAFENAQALAESSDSIPLASALDIEIAEVKKEALTNIKTKLSDLLKKKATLQASLEATQQGAASSSASAQDITRKLIKTDEDLLKTLRDKDKAEFKLGSLVYVKKLMRESAAKLAFDSKWVVDDSDLDSSSSESSSSRKSSLTSVTSSLSQPELVAVLQDKVVDLSQALNDKKQARDEAKERVKNAKAVLTDFDRGIKIRSPQGRFFSLKEIEQQRKTVAESVTSLENNLSLREAELKNSIRAVVDARKLLSRAKSDLRRTEKRTKREEKSKKRPTNKKTQLQSKAVLKFYDSSSESEAELLLEDKEAEFSNYHISLDDTALEPRAYLANEIAVLEAKIAEWRKAHNKALAEAQSAQALLDNFDQNHVSSNERSFVAAALERLSKNLLNKKHQADKSHVLLAKRLRRAEPLLLSLKAQLAALDQESDASSRSSSRLSFD